MGEELFDVYANEIHGTGKRLIASGKTKENAESVIKFAVMRNGVDTEYFAAEPHKEEAHERP